MSEEVASAARRRIVRMMAAGFASGYALAAINVMLPLYATERLGLTKAEFARVLSVRMIGIALGVIVLGAVSDRCGCRRSTMAAMVGAGLSFALLGYLPLGGFLAIVAITSALFSTAFINLNQMVQLADPARPGRVNSYYRAMVMLAGIVAPLAMTRWFGWIEEQFYASGVLVVLVAWWLRSYPVEERAPRFQGLGGELRQMGRLYGAALRHRPLMRYIHLTLIWGAATAAVSTFIALRLTDELQADKTLYGNACAIGSGLTLVVLLVMGPLLDRYPLKQVSLVLYLVATACCIAMGATDSPLATAALLVLFAITTTAMAAPWSMWLGREGDAIGMSSAFAVQKVLSAAYGIAATLVLGWLVPHTGIKWLLLGGGLAGLAVLYPFLRLREPPPLRRELTPPTAAPTAEEAAP
jgi:predicted MFS family arabinose efflux permease